MDPNGPTRCRNCGCRAVMPVNGRCNWCGFHPDDQPCCLVCGLPHTRTTDDPRPADAKGVPHGQHGTDHA